MFVSDNGLLLSCGSGQYGCLGQGDRNDCLKPKLIESLLQEDVVHVSCGPHHVAAVCSAGGVFTWGENSAGQLGLGTNANRFSPSKANMSSLIRYAVCGVDGTMLITDGGNLLAAGSNADNKLGLNCRVGFLMAMKTWFNLKEMTVDEVNHFTPVRLMSKHRAVDISLGLRHTAVVTETGSVLTLGYNHDGQLGTGDCKARDTVTMVKSLMDKTVTCVTCGDLFTACATEDNYLYVWGSRPLSNSNTSLSSAVLSSTINSSALDSTSNSETGRSTDHEDEMSSLDRGMRSHSPSLSRPISSENSFHKAQKSSNGDLPSSSQSAMSIDWKQTYPPSPLISHKTQMSSAPSLASLLSGLSNSGAGNRASRQSSLSEIAKDKKNPGHWKRSMSDTTVSDQHGAMMTVANQLMTAGMGRGFQLCDIAPILTPMEVSLYNPLNPAEILGLDNRPLSAHVVNMTACQEFVFVQVEAAIRISSGQSRKRGPARRSLRSLRRRLNILCRTTLRRTASQRARLAEEPVPMEADETVNDNSEVRTWLRNELDEEQQAITNNQENGSRDSPCASASKEDVQSCKDQMLTCIQEGSRSEGDGEVAEESQLVGSYSMSDVTELTRKQERKPDQESDTVNSRKAVTDPQLKIEGGQKRSPYQEKLVKRRAARKGDKRGIGFSSKGIEQLQKETVRLQAAIDRIQEENAKHRQLLNLVKEEANQTELSLRDEIKRLQEEKRKAEEQVEQLKAEHQLRENKWKAEGTESRIGDEVNKLRSEMHSEIGKLQEDVHTVLNLRDRLSEMERDRQSSRRPERSFSDSDKSISPLESRLRKGSSVCSIM